MHPKSMMTKKEFLDDILERKGFEKMIVCAECLRYVSDDKELGTHYIVLTDIKPSFDPSNKGVDILIDIDTGSTNVHAKSMKDAIYFCLNRSIYPSKVKAILDDRQLIIMDFND